MLEGRSTMTSRLGGARQAAGLIVLALMAACAAAGQQQMIVGNWLAEDIGGEGAIDRAQSVIEFDGEGGVYGSGGCNRFNGPVTLDGNTVQFGLLIATRRACPAAQMDQEDKFLGALYSVRSYRFEGSFLLMSNEAGDDLLRLTRLE